MDNRYVQTYDPMRDAVDLAVDPIALYERADSDYGDFGSDEEELTILENLLQQVDTHQDESQDFTVTDIEDYEPPRGLRLPKVLGREETRVWEVDQSQQQLQIIREFEATNTQKRDEDQNVERERSISAEPETREPDTRSPLERFRRPPKKALSVTDLVSPAWCELQYSYTLSKHGRKKRTPAMKQGTEVHQALQDEIHITVCVEVPKKEDSWGLRIWNVVQGLRTLRETGRTRELEVWGSIGGEVVNGVIDELSYECPDPQLEELFNKRHGKATPEAPLPEYQTSITSYLTSQTQQEQGQSLSEALNDGAAQSDAGTTKQPEKHIYITDVKTRGSQTLPTGASMRPTILQLHLYHHMLENLAQENFSLDQLAERYDLDTKETFSDSFIAQIGNLNQQLFQSSQEQNQSSVPSSQDSIDILLQHNNLSSLWDFMVKQLRATFVLPSATSLNATPTPTPQSTSDLPPPASQPTRLSPILTAEYLSSSYRHVSGTQKKFLGRKSFVFNADFLKQYLEDNLSWWRGEREARGVMLQEAWKCRSCDFRDDCEWIHERDQAAVQQALERKTMREIAGVEKGSKSAV